MRSSALDIQRAPSSPISFPAKHSACEQTPTSAYPHNKAAPSTAAWRLTSNTQVGERGVAFQRTRYETCTLRPKTVACNQVTCEQRAKNRRLPPRHMTNMQHINIPVKYKRVMLELSSSMRPTASPPSSPKSSPAQTKARHRPAPKWQTVNRTRTIANPNPLPSPNPPPHSPRQLQTQQHCTIHVLMCHHASTAVFCSRAPHTTLQPEAPIII